MAYYHLNQSQFEDQFNPFEQYYEKQVRKSQKKRPYIINIPHTTYCSLYQNDFQVDKIKGKRLKGGKLQYLVEWLNYEGQDTWQNIQNLKYVGQLIEDYENQLKYNEMNEKSSHFSIHHAYQYDFSYRGNNLMIEDNNMDLLSNSKKDLLQQATSLSTSNHNQTPIQRLQNQNFIMQGSLSASNWSIDYSQTQQERNKCVDGQINNNILTDSCSSMENSKTSFKQDVVKPAYIKKITQNKDLQQIGKNQKKELIRQAKIRPYTGKIIRNLNGRHQN